jgi:hypothetical protein
MMGTDVSLPPVHHLQFTTANIYKCLAPCRECTGNYISKILQKRLVCKCRCHSIKEDNFGSITSSTIEAGI